MIAEITKNNQTFKVDLSKPLDISIPLNFNTKNLTAWYVNPPELTTVMENGFVGDVNLGGSVNFRNVFFNPHGHGTHTECVGHISKEFISINQRLKQFFCLAKLVSITPKNIANDFVITMNQIQQVLPEDNIEAIIIRTIPNDTTKLSMQYSNTNPAFVHHDAMTYIKNKGVKHLLIDTPSVDKESDGGQLLAHKTFWDYPSTSNSEKTITELIFVDNSIIDGYYLLNIQIAPFENDASPSKPILYKIL